MTGNPKKNAALVEALGSSLRSGEHGLKTGPALLVRVLSEGSWREFVTQRGEAVRYDRFEDFVIKQPLKGLGASMRLIEKLVESIDDPAQRSEAQGLLEAATQRQHGGDRHSKAFKLHNIQLEGRAEDDSQSAPSGTSRAAGLRRLRKDRPDLHAEVLAGALTTHAAMVKAGFRRRMVTIPADSPENVAKALRRNLPPEAIAQLAELLSAES
ncbi:hypothetical protein [Streptomyces sp. WM6372]|uniref:hypothetical protein n=1 Tax=Streptomyces sp. WM6372 TaxID=1415555 RepID=UPI000A7D5075|nr:hypothetical protein [Streptomyces sp. WM6372]